MDSELGFESILILFSYWLEHKVRQSYIGWDKIILTTWNPDLKVAWQLLMESQKLTYIIKLMPVLQEVY